MKGCLMLQENVGSCYETYIRQGDNMVTVNNYYNNIPVGRDLNNLPNTSGTGTTVGYQYDGLTEEDRFV